jgi:cytochrome c-type biogenesis protein CcmH
MTARALIFLLLLSCVSSLVFAKEAKSLADDPELDKRMMALSQQLRCLVCQNETLADSQADLAADLRNQIKEQMKAGKSDAEIIAFLTDRYGDFVLYKPPVKPRTYLLWFGPFILLGGGLFALYRVISHRRDEIADSPLSPEEHRRAEKLLESESKKELA